MYDFSGTTQYIDWLNDTKLNIDHDTFSVSFWVDFDTVSGVQTLICLTNTLDVTADSQKALILRTIGNDLDILGGFATTAGDWNTTGSFPSTGRYHVVVTFDKSSTSNDPVCYVNGSSNSVSEIVAPSGTRTAGVDCIRLAARDENPTLQELNGRLGDIAIYNRILSANEAGALSRGISPYKVGGLVSYIRLNTPSATGVIDEITGAKASTITGATQVAHKLPVQWPELFHTPIFFPTSAEAPTFTPHLMIF